MGRVEEGKGWSERMEGRRREGRRWGEWRIEGIRWEGRRREE